MKKIFRQILCGTLCVVLAMLGFVSVPFVSAASGVMITNLKVNDLVEPLGIDDVPVFSWILTGGKIGGAQTAYELFVATTAEKAAAGIGDVWQSGKVASSLNYDILYGGDPLASKTGYYWAIKVWDEKGVLIGISDVAYFHTGIYDDADWKGAWIGYPQSNQEKMTLDGANWIWGGGGDTASAGIYSGGKQYFRKTFTVDPDTVKSARIAWTADDQSTLYFNGNLLGSTAAWTAGGMTDVTELLVSGTNCIAMMGHNAADGYAGAIARMVIEYTDGREERIVTDQTWTVCTEEVSGWNEINCTAGSWNKPMQHVAYGGDPWKTNLNISDVNDLTRPAIVLRKEFETKKEIASAHAYICGLGFFTLTVNGKPVTDSVMNPCPTQYDHTVLYCVYDVTDLMQDGGNAVGVELGNSFLNETGGVWNWPNAPWRDNPKCKMDLEIVYTDGTSELIASDESWKVTRDGPITNNSLYYGDTYDANKVLIDENGLSFDEAGYDDGAWADAYLMKAPANRDGEVADLMWQHEEPQRRTATYKPERIQRLDETTVVITAPAMTTGWAKLCGINLPAGQELKITYSEKQHEDGTVMKLGGTDGEGENWWSEANIQQDHYISDGSADATYEPRYSYKGFEYIQIEGWVGEFTADNIEMYRINNDMANIGHFETSSDLVNALNQMMRTSIENNMQGRPTDCPVYEKNGWTGDCNVAVDTVMYNYGAQNMMETFINMLADTQESYGNVADIVPSADSFTDNHPTWNTIFVFGATDMARYYGNYSYIEERYEDFRKFFQTDIDIIKSRGWLWPGGSYGDWCSPSAYGNPDATCAAGASEGSKITDNAMLYGALVEFIHVTEELRERAEAAGDAEKVSMYEADLADYRQAADKLYEAYNARFYNASKGYYETGEWSQTGERTQFRQTSQAASLAYGLVPAEYEESVVKALANDVAAKGYHLDTGVVGTKTLLPMLTKYGYDEVAFRVATQMTYPSWGYWIAQGATATWEQWENASRSLNHYMFSSLGEWFYSGIAGITDIRNGYETFTVDPVFSGNLNYANCTIDTVRGALTANWRLNDDGTVTMELAIPYGSTAKVVLPTALRSRNVTVNGKAYSSADGVLKSAVENGHLCLTLTSGSFTVNTPTDLVNRYPYALKDAVDTAEDVNITVCPDGHKAAFEQALREAKAIYADDTATQKQINDAEAALAAAIVAVEGSAARQALVAALDEYGDAETADRDAALIAAYQSAVLTATMLAKDPDATDARLTAAEQILVNAYRLMVFEESENLALNKPCTASSSDENAYWGWSLDFIADGDRQNINIGGEYAGYTSSSNTGVSHTEWVQTDLGANSTFNKYVFYPACTSYNGVMTGFGTPKAYEIQISNDGEKWTTVYTGSLAEAPGMGAVSAEFDTVTARYVRLYATELFRKASEGEIYRLQLSEIEVYNTPESYGEAEGLIYVELSDGDLDPVFEYFTENYTATVESDVDSITVTPYATSRTKITVNGDELTSGSTSAPISLAVGENVITLVAGNRTTTLTVTRLESEVTAIPGDVDTSGTVDVADIMKLKALIMADDWSDEELAVGDMDDSGKLDVGDIMAVKNIIMSK